MLRSQVKISAMLRGIEEYENGAHPFTTAVEVRPGETVEDLAWRLLTMGDMRHPLLAHALEIRLVMPAGDD